MEHGILLKNIAKQEMIKEAGEYIMISMLLAETSDYEKKKFEEKFRSLVAHKSDESLKVIKKNSYDEIDKMNTDNELLHMAITDIMMKEGIKAAESIRSQYPSVEMMLVADSTVNPMRYMKPSIKASALIVRPFSDEEMGEITEEFYDSSMKSLNLGGDDKNYLVQNSDGKTLIPYHKIYYFEAVNKKISVRTAREEYEISGTIEKLLEELPADFMRCHRSFIINRSLIRKVRLSDQMIYMEGKIIVPLSRSYKKQIKEYLNEAKQT